MEKIKTKNFYAGGFLYNPVAQMVLLHKRDSKALVNPNKWAFFGGLNESDETPRQTFTREVREELNVDISRENIQPLCDYLNEELQTYPYVFFAESSLGKSSMKLSEGEDFDWIPVEKVFEYDLTERTRNDLKRFLEMCKV